MIIDLGDWHDTASFIAEISHGRLSYDEKQIIYDFCGWAEFLASREDAERARKLVQLIADKYDKGLQEELE